MIRKKTMKNRRTITLLVLILTLNLVLAVVFRDFIRENILIPILYIFWYARLFIKSLGETCLWPLILIILAMVSLRILRSKKKDRQRVFGYGEESGQLEEGRVAFWMKYIRRKSMGIENLSLVSFRLKELVSSVLAYQGNFTQTEIEDALDKGDLPLPDEIQALLKPKNQVFPGVPKSTSMIQQIMNWFNARSLSGPQGSATEMSKVVKYLEDQLELEHDD
jgi:hypothetical protein